MSEKVSKTQLENSSKISSNSNEKKEVKSYTLSCACCNQDITENKYIGIVHFGTMIHLCGEPCGIRDYLETQ